MSEQEQGLPEEELLRRYLDQLRADEALPEETREKAIKETINRIVELEGERAQHDADELLAAEAISQLPDPRRREVIAELLQFLRGAAYSMEFLAAGLRLEPKLADSSAEQLAERLEFIAESIRQQPDVNQGYRWLEEEQE